MSFTISAALSIISCGTWFLANDKTPTQRTEFPINYDRAAFESDGLKRLAGLSDEAFKAIKELQPYKEGNGELLWVLQELSRTDKHRTIILIGTTHTENEMRFSVGSPGAESFQWISGPVGIKSLAIPIIDGGPIAEITYTSPFPPETHIHNQFTFEVLFGDNSPLVGKRVIQSLTGIGEYVEAIINDFDTGFFK